MSSENHRDVLDALHQLVAGSSDSTAWAASAELMTDWQRGVLTRLHALTVDDDIQYLSSAKLDSGDWDFIAFTDNRVIRVLVTNAATDAVRYETSTFPRASLDSLELLDVDPIPEADQMWPTDVNLIGHYRVGSVPLPLDKFASKTNKRELNLLLRSLLQDLAH